MKLQTQPKTSTIPKIKNVDKLSLEIYNSSINDLKFENYTNKQKSNIVDELVKMRIYLGIVDEPTPLEYLLNTEFIIKNYPTLNLNDLSIAKDLVASGELKIKQSITDLSFVKFSPIYIGNILSNYITYKRESIYKVRKEIEKINSIDEIEPTDSEKVETFRKKLVYAFTETLKGNEFYDFGDTTFDFISKNDLLEFTDELIKQSIDYGIENAQHEQNKNQMKSVIGGASIEKINFKEVRKKHSRQFMVNHWLKVITDFETKKQKSKEELKLLYEKLNNFLDTISIEMIQ